MTLNDKDLEKLSRVIQDRDFCEAKLRISEDALIHCHDSYPPTDPWYQSQSIIISGFVFSFSAGMMIGLTHCFGMCK